MNSTKRFWDTVVMTPEESLAECPVLVTSLLNVLHCRNASVEEQDAAMAAYFKDHEPNQGIMINLRRHNRTHVLRPDQRDLYPDAQPLDG